MNDRRHATALVATAVLIATATGCGVRVHPSTPSYREDVRGVLEEMEVLPPFPTPAAGSGSLWVAGGHGDRMFRDSRAMTVNDLLTVQIDEQSLGTNESTTDLSRSSQADVGASTAFGLESANPQAGKFNLNSVLQSDFSSSFTGDGATSRANRLSGTLTVRVLRVLPNGNLVIGGQKSVTVNRERHVITLVGSVRRDDITASNVVGSSRVGDLTMRMWGQGEIDATIRQGWFMRMLNTIWPL